MFKTFRYRIYPNKRQEKTLLATLETCRRFYNECLAERKQAYEEQKKSIGKFAQLRHVKILKDTSLYAATIHSHVLQVVVVDLDKAFQAFFRRVKSGETPGYPRFKGRNRFDSFGFKEYGNGFKLDGRRLKLSGIGRIRVFWHRSIEGNIKTLRIRRTADGWYATFSCEGESTPLPETGQGVGVDVGISSLIATSDGKTVENPKWYREQQVKLRVLQRRVARRKKGSYNCQKAVVQLRRFHEYIANSRKDFLNKLAHNLVAQYDLIALEDLQILNMVQNHNLAKSILDGGWGYLKQQLTFKAAEAGRELILVNPAYTSKSCSNCGQVFENLTLADRWVECECGLSLDRDINAARNILFQALKFLQDRDGQSRWAVTWAVAPCVAQEAPGF
jgi:putative transposase